MRPLLLILGPSGVGKSSTIRQLCASSLFQYVRPVTTRPLRLRETDKTHVSVEVMERMMNTGKLLTVNQLYGFLYGTPKEAIDSVWTENRVPVIDWPISCLGVMQATYGRRLLCVYLLPPSRDVLRQRLSDRALEGNGRLKQGLAELDSVEAGKYEGYIDHFVVCRDDAQVEIAEEISLFVEQWSFFSE